MSILITLMLFVLLVIAGTILNNLFPKIPAALFQIILGAAITFLPLHLTFEFESEMFMMLVIAPLLFSDGYNASRQHLWMYKRPILLMAVGLVLVTVFLVGFMIHLLLPSIPLAASFALAAILSPTDAVAVKSITKGMKLPKGLMSILEGESLLNDAAGLVSFNIAVAAILTNTFSLAKATQNFLFVALGGAILGLILGVLLERIKYKFAHLIGEESNVMVIFQLMTPVVVYFIAEHLHVSGVIAVVITSIIYNFARDLFNQDALQSEPLLLIDAGQMTVGYILNGFVFVFLGYLLPEIVLKVVQTPELRGMKVMMITIIITLALILVRFLFVYLLYVRFQEHSFTSVKKVVKVFRERKLDVGNYTRFEYALITALCGIHGTVTMATALLIPVALSNGEALPLRDTILFIASGVVLLSMIIGTITLPIMIKSTDEQDYLERNAIRQQVIDETIIELKARNFEQMTAREQLAFAQVLKQLEEQRIALDDNHTYLYNEIKRIYRYVLSKENEHMVRLIEQCPDKSILLKIFDIHRLRRAKLLNYSLLQQIILQLMISYKETIFKRLSLKYYFKEKLTHSQKMGKITDKLPNVAQYSSQLYKDLDDIVHQIIDEITTDKNKLAAQLVYDVYRYFSVTQYHIFIDNENYNEELSMISSEAIQLQKYRVMTMRKLNFISEEDANLILRDMNYEEALIFNNQGE